MQEAIIFLAESACVMVNSNLWVDIGLVNGAMRTVQTICYQTGGPPDLPVAVIVSPPSLMALCLSLLSTAGPASAHVSSCAQVPSPSISHRVSPWAKWPSTVARKSSPLGSHLLPAQESVSYKASCSHPLFPSNVSPASPTALV
jgi:hypothetical protein